MPTNMIPIPKIIVSAEQTNTRLDIFLSEELKMTRSQAHKLIENGLVLVNDKLPKKAGDRVKTNDEIFVKKPVVSAFDVDKQKKKENLKFKIDVVVETDDYVVINKPAGLLVHPTEANEPHTLTDWLKEKYPEIINVGDSQDRPGIVHRLDKEASGLLVVARTQKMFKHLKKQFQAREMEKEYLVLVYGQVEADHDVVDFEIDRGKDGRMVSRPKTDRLKLKNVKKFQPGKEAMSEFWIEKKMARFTLLRVKIHTGRTHQIRVHMLAYNHPVVGDEIYYNKNLFKKGDKHLMRLFLHSTKLCFVDLKKTRQCFEVELPKELTDYLKKLK